MLYKYTVLIWKYWETHLLKVKFVSIEITWTMWTIEKYIYGSWTVPTDIVTYITIKNPEQKLNLHYGMLFVEFNTYWYLYLIIFLLNVLLFKQCICLLQVFLHLLSRCVVIIHIFDFKIFLSKTVQFKVFHKGDNLRYIKRLSHQVTWLTYTY